MEKSDVVSVHIDGKKENTNFISSKEFNMMKGSIFINYNRGNVVDINALIDNLSNDKLLGAAIDVFPKEPLNKKEFQSKLRGFKNLILSPHIGGSTKKLKNIGHMFQIK